MGLEELFDSVRKVSRATFQRYGRVLPVFVVHQPQEKGGKSIGGVWEIIRDSQGNGTVTKFERFSGNELHNDIGAFGNMFGEERTMQ